jgi:hypothetical protein
MVSPKKKELRRQTDTPEETETWRRFERAVDIALRTKPMHQPSKRKPIARRKGKKAG